MVATNVGRNDPCPCGSGKKFKKCCLSKADEARRAAAREVPHDHDHVCDDPSHHHDHGGHDHHHRHEHGDHDHEHVHGEHCDHDHEDEDEDEGPLDPIWDELADQPLERRYELTLARVTDGEPLEAETCIDLINSIGIELLQVRRGPELGRLLDTARAHRAAVLEEYGAFDRALRAWMALQGDGGVDPLLDMARHASDDPEELLQLLDAYLYHGRSSAVAQAVGLAVGGDAFGADERPEILDELHDFYVQTAIVEALEANPELDAVPKELVERLRAIGEVDQRFLRELVTRRSGRAGEALDVEEIRGVKTLDEAEQVVFLLSLEFCGVLAREHGFSRARAELARAELAAYLTERMFDIAKPDGRATKQALRGVPKRAGYLLPDASTATTHLEHSADPVLGSVHRATAMLGALPAWFGFLAARGLTEADEGPEVIARIRSSAKDLPGMAEVFCEDPDVLDDLRAALGS